jgi:tetratricopeptide (TPR) repeat protein
MKNTAGFAAVALAVGCAALVILNMTMRSRLSRSESELDDLKESIAGLRERLHAAKSQEDSANGEILRLRNELSALADRRKGDLLVLEQVWDALQQIPRPAGSGDPSAARTVKYDVAAIRELLASGDGDLESLLGQILTPEGITAMLQEHSDNPTYWVAAASLSKDPEAALGYLEEAARLYPKSPTVLSSLIEAYLRKDQIDENTMARIADLKQADPTNPLPDYYDAYCRFQQGDVQGAIASIAEASTKDKLTDYGMDILMARRDFFLDGGCSDSVALGMSAFTLGFSELSLLRNAGRSTIEQARLAFEAGQSDEALQMAGYVLNAGRTLSSSGRFLIQDLVGISLQTYGLTERRRVYEARGDTLNLREVDAQLRAIEERTSMIRVMGQSFGGALQNMTDQDIANYVKGAVLNGEFSTLRNLPGMSEILEQARNEPQ